MTLEEFLKTGNAPSRVDWEVYVTLVQSMAANTRLELSAITIGQLFGACVALFEDGTVMPTSREVLWNSLTRAVFALTQQAHDAGQLATAVNPHQV